MAWNFNSISEYLPQYSEAAWFSIGFTSQRNANPHSTTDSIEVTPPDYSTDQSLTHQNAAAHVYFNFAFPPIYSESWIDIN